jgi:hypothetical protein
MRLLVSKLICRLFAVGLVAVGMSLALGITGTFVGALLIASAIGLALLQRWAFFPAIAVPFLYMVESIADAIHVRWLRPSHTMPSLLGRRFKFNFAMQYFLERPADFFSWYGIPEQLAKMLLCLFAIGALVYAHRLLATSGSFRRIQTSRDKLIYARVIGVISKAVVGIATLIIAMAVWKDPPGLGSNPGGPGPGTSVFFAVLFTGPWLIAGGIGWALSARRLRQGENADKSAASSTEPNPTNP